MTRSEATLDRFLDELEWRGMFHAATPGLAARLATRRTIAGYNGFDPSGPSLHIGHLVPIMGLVRFQAFGGRPVALVRGAAPLLGEGSIADQLMPREFDLFA